MSTIEAEFLKCSAEKLDQLCGRIESCLDRLTPEQIWTRGGENQNAIGNLVLHLSGNVRQWILHGVGGEADHRIRDIEFSTRDPQSTTILKQRLRSTVDEAVSLLPSLRAEQLMEQISVQDYDNVTKMQAIFHVVEHFSGHTGQVIFLTKWLTGEDLGFYAHLQNKSHTETVP
jgi:uncharacterized damage-inducible protein DinB